MMSPHQTTANPPRVAVIGGGAIGGVVAAAAQRAGLAVTLCVRTPIPALSLERAGQIRTVPLTIASDPATLPVADWVLLATKAQDSAGAGPWLSHLVGHGTTVVVLQNGVEHEDRVRPLVGEAPIIPAVVYIAAERVGPGHIVHHLGNQIIVPRTEAAATFATLLAGGELDITLVDDFVTAAWRKLLSNVAANPLTALTLRRVEVLHDPAIHDLARGLLQEAVTVGRSVGADLSAQDIDDVLALYARYDVGGTSMLYDRLAGRPLEHDHLTGTIVRTAARRSIPVPLNQAMLALLQAVNTAPPTGTPAR
ncbi:MAG: 2-dehydropantoate 2-reductase [Azospirillaceae bacterium]|nr:2-dehydropantoate 2-reductase [Azospirillaceae bacterium]